MKQLLDQFQLDFILYFIMLFLKMNKELKIKVNKLYFVFKHSINFFTKFL